MDTNTVRMDKSSVNIHLISFNSIKQNVFVFDLSVAKYQSTKFHHEMP